MNSCSLDVLTPLPLPLSSASPVFGNSAGAHGTRLQTNLQ